MGEIADDLYGQMHEEMAERGHCDEAVEFLLDTCLPFRYVCRKPKRNPDESQSKINFEE